MYLNNNVALVTTVSTLPQTETCSLDVLVAGMESSFLHKSTIVADAVRTVARILQHMIGQGHEA